MTGVIEKEELRKSLRKEIPRQYHGLVFGDQEQTCCFEQLFKAMTMHFGELEIMANREYRRGYEDGQNGRAKQPW